IETAATVEADVMLMDVNMQPVNGFEATKKIVRQSPSLKIIGVSVNSQPSYAKNMIQLGARGYVTKDCTKKEMIHAILTVYSGGRYISEEIRKKNPGNNETGA
ncbi:MAG TPA: response regulator, partial [Chitinophagaceae bacterium]